MNTARSSHSSLIVVTVTSASLGYGVVEGHIDTSTRNIRPLSPSFPRLNPQLISFLLPNVSCCTLPNARTLIVPAVYCKHVIPLIVAL